MPLRGVSEMNNVAVLNGVILAFESQEAFFFGLRVSPAVNQNLPIDHFRLDEPFFKISMDYAGRLGRFGTGSLTSPGSGFFGAGRKESNEIEDVIAFKNKFFQPGHL